MHDANYTVIVGDFPRSTQLLDEALDLACRTGDSTLVARARYTSAMLATFTGDLAFATAEFGALAAKFHAAGDRQRELASVYHLGWCTGFTGDPHRGRQILHTGLKASTEHNGALQ
ncbi:hypothetical protein P3102_34175 [Amycolatopsis sp. QT-25]|uniref:hypothetical protein n=1 Tax=Amycolatopsis sp. QT-25 TaxID=3034022 RepID=UPI0023ED148D|nr:hypothetical protein [Amycolatopsis sp. QT-25]WET79026.1 hypothetical protein P3102_34175 [Amycolatopsis sp. QT-25]